ncbi:MAG: hypothetical protein K2J77_12070 [Oscillospiraceae bacterium]|nr:hypothetical protein [Oscillospiraceae bacterium]
MRILFAGGDARTEYAAKRLSRTHEIVKPGEIRGRLDAVVLPLPLSKDGETVFGSDLTFEALFEEIGKFADEHTLVLAGGEASALSELCERRGFTLINYFALEALTLKNAALTAEAALCLLSQSTDGALLGSETLVAGSGRIAMFLAERLRACQSKVTLAARDPAKRELFKLRGFINAVPLDELPGVLPCFDFIANTIPAPIFGEEMFAKMREGAVYIELATLPAEPLRTFAERSGIKYIFAGGLPGKCSPKAAGEAIAETVEEILATRSR